MASEAQGSDESESWGGCWPGRVSVRLGTSISFTRFYNRQQEKRPLSQGLARDDKIWGRGALGHLDQEWSGDHSISPGSELHVLGDLSYPGDCCVHVAPT